MKGAHSAAERPTSSVGEAAARIAIARPHSAGDMLAGDYRELDNKSEKVVHAKTKELDLVEDDDVPDMFNITPTDEAVAVAPAVRKGLVDGYDDAEGYYNFQVHLNARFVALRDLIIVLGHSH